MAGRFAVAGERVLVPWRWLLSLTNDERPPRGVATRVTACAGWWTRLPADERAGNVIRMGKSTGWAGRHSPARRRASR